MIIVVACCCGVLLEANGLAALAVSPQGSLITEAMSMQVAEAGVGAFQALKSKIEKKTARVGIVGLGYVGLPLAVEFAKAGFHVTGLDLQRSRVDRLMEGESYIQDVADGEVAQLVKEGRLDATTDFSVVRDLDTVNICVPTPLR